MANRGIIDRISPLWLGIGISGFLISILAAQETVLGRWDALMIGGEFDALARVSSGVLRDVRIAFVHCLVMGYVPAALLQVFRNGRRSILLLQGALDCDREECETLAASITLNARGIVITGLIGLVLAFIPPYLIPPVPDTPWSPSTWTPEVVWHRLLGPLLCVWQMWLGYAVVIVSLRMSRIARKLRRINLLDLSPLAPFTQLGLTNALLLVGLLSMWSLMMLETGFGRMIIIIGSLTLAGTAIVVLSPVRGVNRRILQSKEVELGWVNKAISKQRSALQNPDAGRHSGEMADLVAYRGLIESVPEWPFTNSTYARFTFYLLIPIATWSIGMVAEEIIGRVFF